MIGIGVSIMYYVHICMHVSKNFVRDLICSDRLLHSTSTSKNSAVSATFFFAIFWPLTMASSG